MGTSKRDDGSGGDDGIASDAVFARNPRLTMASGGDDSGRVQSPSVSNSGGSIILSTLRSEERELLGLVDGRRSVEELARLATLPLPLAQKHLRALRDRGILVPIAMNEKPPRSDFDIPDPADLPESDSGDGSSALTRAIDEYLELAASALNNAAEVEESTRPTVGFAAVGNEIVDRTERTESLSGPAAFSTAGPGGGGAATPASGEPAASPPRSGQPKLAPKSGPLGFKPNVTQFWIPAMGDPPVGAAPTPPPEELPRAPSPRPDRTALFDRPLPGMAPPGSGPTVVVKGSRAPAANVADGRAAPAAGPAGNEVPRTASARYPAALATNPFKVGPYEVASRIAQGGMGSIYVCRRAGESGLQRLFVLKVVRQHSAQRAEAVQSFKREAHVGSLLSHPNLQTVLDVGSYKNQPFLILDYVEGTSLSDLLTDDRRAPVPVIVSILADVLRGLHYAHELRDEKGARLNLVHGDISPQNVLVGVDGAARLTDFGSATFTGEGRATGPKWVPTGKPAYMAPEQLQAEPLDARTDVFAVGILMWSALTGQKLFSGDSYDETILKVLRKKIPAPSVFGAPAFLDEVCLKALSRAREGRYASAEEMERDLLRVAAQEKVVASATEVGQWVRRESGEGLAEQRRRIQLMFGGGKVSPGRVYTPATPGAPGVPRAPAPTVVLDRKNLRLPNVQSPNFETPQFGATKTVSPRTVFLPALVRPKAFWDDWKVVIISALLALPVTLTIGYFLSNLMAAKPQPPAAMEPQRGPDAASFH